MSEASVSAPEFESYLDRLRVLSDGASHVASELRAISNDLANVGNLLSLPLAMAAGEAEYVADTIRQAIAE